MDLNKIKSQFFWESAAAAVIAGVFVFGGFFALFKIGSIALSGSPLEKIGARIQGTVKATQEKNKNKEEEKRKQELLKTAIYPAPFIGSEDASVEIEGFFDFSCPYTKLFFTNPILKKSREAISKSKNAKLSFRNFPIIGGDKSQESALAAACAGEQGRFWQMAEQILNHQEDIKRSNLGFSGYANEIGLNIDLFDYCATNKKYEDLILQDSARAEKLGIKTLPAFVINGKIIKEGLPGEKEIEKWISAN